MDSITCAQCSGKMSKKTVGEHNISVQVLGVFVFLIGVGLLFVFPIGTFIGIILMIAAARMGYKRKKIWKCEQCGYFFERK